MKITTSANNQHNIQQRLSAGPIVPRRGRHEAMHSQPCTTSHAQFCTTALEPGSLIFEANSQARSSNFEQRKIIWSTMRGDRALAVHSWLTPARDLHRMIAQQLPHLILNGDRFSLLITKLSICSLLADIIHASTCMNEKAWFCSRLAVYLFSARSLQQSGMQSIPNGRFDMHLQQPHDDHFCIRTSYDYNAPCPNISAVST